MHGERLYRSHISALRRGQVSKGMVVACLAKSFSRACLRYVCFGLWVGGGGGRQTTPRIKLKATPKRFECVSILEIGKRFLLYYPAAFELEE